MNILRYMAEIIIKLFPPFTQSRGENWCQEDSALKLSMLALRAEI